MTAEQPNGSVRIIGGKWRSRKLVFPSVSGVRPTHDRIRETLFNWLSTRILDSVCLDLFAGSGALGFEALSRGAQFVTFVDSAKIIVEALNGNAERLKVEPNTIEILHAQFPNQLPTLTKKAYNLVFLDPPYRLGLIALSLEWLQQNALLEKEVLIYIETEKELVPLPIPAHWKIIREKETATLRYYLVSG